MTEDDIPYMHLLPEYFENLPKRNQIVWIFTKYEQERVKDKTASLCNSFTLQQFHFAMAGRYFAMGMQLWKQLFVNKVELCLQKKLPSFLMTRFIPKNIGPSARTSMPMKMQHQLYKIFDNGNRAVIIHLLEIVEQYLKGLKYNNCALFILSQSDLGGNSQ